MNAFSRSYAKQPLFGMEFFIIGENKKPQIDIANQIQVLGGKIASRIHSRIAAIISNVNEVEKVGGPMTNAQLHGIQVVPEEFLDEVPNGDPCELIAEKNISKWGRDV